MRPISTTPDRIIAPDGTIAYGTFRMPFRTVNLLDAPLYAFPVPRAWKNFRLKEWQHYGIITPTHYIGAVIFDAKFMGLSFVYVYDRGSKVRFEHARKRPGRQAIVASQMYDGVCRFEAPGYRLVFENRLDAGFHRILIDIAAHDSLPALQGEILVHEDPAAIEPLVQVSPITALRPFYTHKAATPASGSLCIGSTQTITLGENTSIALIDEQKTYYPYVSFWQWAMAAGYQENGVLTAFNLCRNLISDDEDQNENCVWIDGKIMTLRGARFEIGADMAPWRVCTTDGAFDAQFEPEGRREEHISIAGLIRSDFRQPFGQYRGHFTDESGCSHDFSRLFGLAEHHVTRY